MAADLVEKPSWGGVKTPWDPCSPQEGVERSAPPPGDFRVIVGPTPPQMDDFCDLLGTPYPPVSRIVTVKCTPRFIYQFLIPHALAYILIHEC